MLVLDVEVIFDEVIYGVDDVLSLVLRLFKIYLIPGSVLSFFSILYCKVFLSLLVSDKEVIFHQVILVVDPVLSLGLYLFMIYLVFGSVFFCLISNVRDF